MDGTDGRMDGWLPPLLPPTLPPSSSDALVSLGRGGRSALVGSRDTLPLRGGLIFTPSLQIEAFFFSFFYPICRADKR